MQLLENKVDVIANNLANISTSGYKRRDVSFQQMVEAEQALDRNMLKVKLPDGFTPTYTDNSDGRLKQTANPLDIALSGRGFFQIKTNNGLAYTRDGNFKINNEGQLVTPDGYKVMGSSGPIEINGSKIDIDQSGQISVDGKIVNQFLFKKINIDDSIVMQDNLYKQKENGYLEDAHPVVNQGFIEESNVNNVKEMVEMIAAQRLYEANQKLIKAQDDTLNKAVNQIARS
jgi:flagellar basal-body rod protein FlgG